MRRSNPLKERLGGNRSPIYQQVCEGGLTLLYFVEYWLHTEKDEGSNLHCFVVFYSFICSGLCIQDETLGLISSIGRILVVWLLGMQNQNEYSRWKPVLWMIKSPTIQSTQNRDPFNYSAMIICRKEMKLHSFTWNRCACRVTVS